jgi:hypothetical protein
LAGAGARYRGNVGGFAEHEHLAVTGLRGLPGDIEERRRRQQ